MVVKIGGAALDNPAAADALWAALAEAHRALEGRLVLVHGGGSAADRHLERLGMRSERREGIRITPPEQIWEIAAVLAGRVNKQLVGALARLGVRAVGLSLGDGGLLRTAKADQYYFDPGRVGRVVGGDPTVVDLLTATGFLPVLCSIGLDDSGEPLNINADEAAAGLARVLRAGRLVLLTDVPGVLGADRRRIDQLTAAQINGLVASGVIHGGMIPKVRAAADAANASGGPATIASWNTPEDLVRLARGGHAGTTVLPDAAHTHTSIKTAIR